MKNLAVEERVNGTDVPEKYRVPMQAVNLDGFRLLLLEEIESESPEAFT